jgi:folate/biopterin transporter
MEPATKSAGDLEGNDYGGTNNENENPLKFENKSSVGKLESSPLLRKDPKFNLGFGLVEWFETLGDSFGYRLLVMLFFVQHLMKGFVASLSIKATPYLYRGYHLAAPQVQIYSGVAQLPWSMKPIIGLISDVFPIRGYNKAPYMIMTSLAGGIAFACIGLCSQASMGIQALVICMFMKSLQLSTADLLSEAKYAEKMHKVPEHGPSLLTYVWFGMQVGGLFATIISGPIMHAAGPRTLFLICAFPALGILIPLAMGFMEEKKATPEAIREARAQLWKQSEACFLCILMLMGTIILSVIGLVSKEPLTNCIVAVAVAVIMLVAFSLVLSPTIAKFNAFSLVQTSLKLSTGGASFYFYTDSVAAFPDGPHFSEFFYNSVLGTVGAVCSLFGIFCYQRYMKSWKYRELLIFCNVVCSCLSVCDILVFARVNKRIGIPDHVLVFGLSAFEEIVNQWAWMPQVVILSYLCPKGMEATMYALLAGCHNLGNTIGSSAGALLMDRLGVKPTGANGESAQFQNLWVASVVATVLPFVAIFALIKLVPDARQNEKLVSDQEYDATSGSLLNQWIRRRNNAREHSSQQD